MLNHKINKQRKSISQQWQYTVCFFYAEESICQLDTLIINEIYLLMSLFLRYVITFDKQKRNLQFFYYVEYNVIKTEVG